MLYSAKLSFKTDRKLKVFQDKHKLRQYVMTNTTQQKVPGANVKGGKLEDGLTTGKQSQCGKETTCPIQQLNQPSKLTQ